MKTTKQILIATGLVSAVVVYACQKETNSSLDQSSTLSVFLTDHQTPVFDSVFIDIQKLEVKLEDDALANGGWFSLAIRAGVYNILRFRNGLDTLFGTATLPNNRIRKIRLTLGTGSSVMKDNQSFALKVNDNERQVVVNIDHSNFDIVAPGQVMFWIDFDAGRSIRVDNSGQGTNNGFELRSHVKVFTHRNSGRIEGRVLPHAATPIVKAINGSDTATAIPEDDGDFKIVGLNAGIYSVLFDGTNGYRDTTVTNIIIKAGEDTHVPTITLRQ
ncbi:MAG TPA: DUF4382 domain-containing protein [Chitinophagaceae bacterium]|nr:DUF4382 domain-containing protein [Chitinophagaceae bacterium]